MAQTVYCPSCGKPSSTEAAQANVIICASCGKGFRIVPESATLNRSSGGFVPPPSMPSSQGAQVNYHNPNYAPQKTSALAITALVLGCLSILFFPLGIVAIILGIIALVKMKDPAVGGKGLAIAGISVGAAGFVLSGCMMMSILLPSLNRAREVANRVKCASNMRQIGQAILMYANENRGKYPDTPDLLLTTQDLPSEAFNCPSSSETPATGADTKAAAVAFNAGGHNSYVYFGKGLNTSVDPEMIVVYEVTANHNGDGGNVLFADGHVEFLPSAAMQTMINELNTGHNPPRPASRRGP